MDKKNVLLNILENAEDFVSGNELAGRLGVTRASIWKYIKALKSDGYDIDAVTNRGYRLSASSDVVTACGIAEELGTDADNFSIEVLGSCTSTNTVLKERAGSLSEWHTVIAGSQTAGRGRLGRSFYSPEGTGLYMSILLRPKLTAEDAVFITTAAAVAMCRAIDEIAGIRAEIKWVNDIFVNDRKVCGILTEASVDMESGAIEYAILGVGINVTAPEAGFPEELSDIAGAVFERRQNNIRNRLAAAFLKHIFLLCSALPESDFVNEYQERCFLVGRHVNVMRGGDSGSAVVLGVDDRCRLMVRYADGREDVLSSGEVSVRSAEISK